MKKPGSRAAVGLKILVAIVATAAAVSLLFNVTSGGATIDYEIHSSYGVSDPQFHRTMGALLGPPLVGGNRLSAYQNGAEIFPAMLAAIRGAQRTINFETYIYWSGEVGRAFADALGERSRSGVQVRVLLDWAGAGKLDETLLDAMRRDGVEVVKFRPLKWYNLDRMNNRTHRKLLIVDGEVGFTGGVGIADPWQGHAQDPEHWRDSHYRVEGPAVAHMQAAFMENWIKTRSRVLHGDEFFPPLEAEGDAAAQMFTSAPDGGAETVRLMYLLSIAAARHTLRLSASYFVPDSLAREALISAAERGVRVEIIVPGRHIDYQIVRKASRAEWGPLLEAGIAIYEFQPTLYHCKVMIVDDLWASVGSTNFDNRSFKLNAEANLNVLDSAFAAELVRVFEEDKTRARRITLEMWRARPWTEKVQEKLANLFRSQL